MLKDHVDDVIEEIVKWRDVNDWTTASVMQQLERLARACCNASGRDFDAEVQRACDAREVKRLLEEKRKRSDPKQGNRKDQ